MDEQENFSDTSDGNLRKKSGIIDVVISLPEPFIFLASLGASIYFLFRHSNTDRNEIWKFAGALNGSPNLSDLIVVFIPACVTAFGSMYLISRSAVLGIRDERLRNFVNSISFIIMLFIVACLVVMLDDFRDALAMCSINVSGEAGDIYKCGEFEEFRINILNVLFFIITCLTIISMGLSKFIVIALKGR